MTTDKSKTVSTSIRLLNEKLHFEGNIDGIEPICPVWSMLDKGVKTTIEFSINQGHEQK